MSESFFKKILVEQNIKLIIGLGNIGTKFNNTRHNIGFAFLDYLLSHENKWKNSSKFFAEINEEIIAEQKIILCKPTTMMNSSGRAVSNITQYYNLEDDNILLVYDDLDINFEDWKLQFNKQPKSHNGVNSVIDSLGSTKFWSLRLGIENRSPDQIKNQSGADYVLSAFNASETAKLQAIFKEVVSD